MILDDLCLFVYEPEDIRRVVGHELALCSNQVFVVFPVEFPLVHVDAVIDKLSNQVLVVLDEEWHDLLHLTLHYHVVVGGDPCSFQDALVVLDPGQENQQISVLPLFRNNLEFGHDILLDIHLVSVLIDLEHLVSRGETLCQIVKHIDQVIGDKLGFLDNLNNRI